MARLQSGEGRMGVWAQYINVTDTQTATQPRRHSNSSLTQSGGIFFEFSYRFAANSCLQTLQGFVENFILFSAVKESSPPDTLSVCLSRFVTKYEPDSPRVSPSFRELNGRGLTKC